MSKTYTVTSSQVSKIHNALVYLNYALDIAKENFKDESRIVRELTAASEYLTPVSEELNQKKDKDWDKMYKMADSVKELYGFENSIWSIYEIESFEDKSSVPSGSKLISYYSGKSIFVTVEGPTWLDLWEATDKLIGLTKDLHGDHIFIEKYFKSKIDNFYEVSLGS